MAEVVESVTVRLLTTIIGIRELRVTCQTKAPRCRDDNIPNDFPQTTRLSYFGPSMRLVDCGTSGTLDFRQPLGWKDLPIESPWDEVLEALGSGSAPKPAQAKALIEHRIFETRRNLIVSAPTNGGKSLVGLLVLLDALRRGGRAILLEPLRAIAKEKAEELWALAPRVEEILATSVRVRISTGDYRANTETLFASPPGQGELIVATPERLEAILRNPEHDAWLSSVEAVCVDEAHLIASPHRGPTLEYLITRLLCLPAPPRLVLLSATLGDLDRACSWLSPCDAIVVKNRQPPLKKEVLELSPEEDANEAVTMLVREILTNPSASVLIFVYQTRSTERLATLLREALEEQAAGPAGPLAYHGQMGTVQREHVRTDFREGRCRCVVSTTALSLGVNLPATHVIVRDTTFAGNGPVSAGNLLQMMGRAGRGNLTGHAVAIVRPNDARGAEDLAKALSEEHLPGLTSHFERVAAHTMRKPLSHDTEVRTVATHVAAHLSRCQEIGATVEELAKFFERSLGGQHLVRQLPSALTWLCDPTKVLAYQGEKDSYALTALGSAATRTVIPLDLAAGFAQLLRDLLTLDPSDQLLAKWRPLDHLIVLGLLYERVPKLRRYSASLAKELDAWVGATHYHTSLLYEEWISGSRGASRASEVLGSLGIYPRQATGGSEEWAFKEAHLATLHAAALFELGQGIPVEKLEPRWNLKGLNGLEERWRDDFTWLLSGLTEVLDLRCFYYHLREECGADPDRIKRVKKLFQEMRTQAFKLREHLSYASPLGPIFRAIRASRLDSIGPSVGTGSLRRLEEAGIRSFKDLAALNLDDLLKLGIRRDLAQQIHTHVSGAGHRPLRPSLFAQNS